MKTTELRPIELRPIELRPASAMEMSPWRIAEHYGVGYAGDLNPFDHGGYFYRTDEWTAYGTADTVGFCADDGQTWLTSGSAYRPDDFTEAFKCCDIPAEHQGNICAQIEASAWYHGTDAETLKTYSDDDSGDDGELEAWALILEQIHAWLGLQNY